jgi:hypothetical protein
MKRKRVRLFVVAFLAIYVGTYLVLSLIGTYRPGTVGLRGVKDWVWLPKYFTDNSGRWRWHFIYTFLPLFWLDIRYWHNDWTGESGPRDETLPPRKPPNKVTGANAGGPGQLPIRTRSAARVAQFWR